MNVLYIMADQLRWDHLTCAGHPTLRTANLDALAARGVRFTQAYVNSGVCGPNRMSHYTGRYPVSHGATWNRVPLSVGEVTMGEYLRSAGLTLALAGKTHVLPDQAGLKRLQLLEGDSELATLLARGSFVEVDRYDGHHEPGAESGYPAYLRRHGYDGKDPWHEHVIATIDPRGEVHSGWSMRHVRWPARVAEPHSETAYMTDQAIGFVQRMGSEPWVLHLSYVKPHWPYVAPSPYHAMFTADQCPPPVRNQAERENEHPALAAYRQHEESLSFSTEECVRTVRPVYQGLVQQLDDHLGRLFDALERQGVLKDTLVIFTADHGDFLGDHWLGEKELFYDTIQRVPLIVVDPRPQADATRGCVDDRFVEAVDILPTILDTLGQPLPMERLEGRSLLPLLHGHTPPWRDFVYAELDYSFRQARLTLGRQPLDCRAFSIRTADWRYVHWLDLPEQLYDLKADPDQFQDLGREAGTEAVRATMRDRLLGVLERSKRRVTVDDAYVAARTNTQHQLGIHFGRW